MATELKVPNRRRATHLIAPKHLQPNAEYNGRFVKISAKEFEERLADFVANGQNVPILFRSDGGMPIIVDGCVRWELAIEGIKRKLLPKDFELECVPFKGNEHQAFLTSVRVNRHRSQDNPIDDAHNIAKMERLQMSHEQIAAEYRRDVTWVKNTLALVTLTPEGMAALSTGKLKAPAARALARLSSQQQREKLDSGQPLTAATIRSNGEPKKPSASERLALANQSLANMSETLRVLVEQLSRMPPRWDSPLLPTWADVAGMLAEEAVVKVCAELRGMIEGKPAEVAA